MTVHLLKLCVGVDSLDQLRHWQARRVKIAPLRHITRMTPKRKDELLDGGSLYWVIKGHVQARQRLVGLEPVQDGEIRRCALMLDEELVPTRWQPRRPHQGWRYLDPKDAPPDLRDDQDMTYDMPTELVAELRELGLI
ncbi:DUF1489 family protein [Oceanibacterium hippocampi]|uniref:Lysophospholipase n=1 Tax=Oceanibacterium hippocampi TaxID=745714 RepID=A0A1Y5SJ73_9PROT|nr:DUF1489 domain-containing protein [Oceanibacterium hippocampi]SLN40872.1 hypothetical protein OCH7691_01740 [Oceanibacterium hippocampi]